MDSRLADLSHLLKRPVDEWRAAGYWGQEPLWQRVKRRAESDPDRITVFDETGHLTNRELWQSANDIAKALRKSGVGHGDIVLVQLPNWREYVQLVVGIEAAGAVLGFCPSTWGARETARALDLLQPKIWFVSADVNQESRLRWRDESLRLSEHRPGLFVGVRFSSSDILTFTEWSASALDDDLPLDGARGLDPVEIAVTSGTTGIPKGVVHVHDTVLATVESTIIRQHISSSDIIHLAIPVGHTFGYFYGVRCALQAGAILLLQEKWNAEVAAGLVGQHKATISLGPAACVVDLLSLTPEAQKKLSSLWLFTQSGDALPQPVAERASKTFNFRISRALGMTEFGHAASTDVLSPAERVLDSAGSPQPGVRVDIRKIDPQDVGTDAGRVFISGPCLFAGYLHANKLDKTVVGADGFFETGDLGWVGNDGYIHIVGREKNIIRRGAVTVPIAEVQDAVTLHPLVNHAVLVPLPDERLGERVAVCVQPLRDGAAPTLDAIHAHLAALGMTRIFWPSELLVVQEWPLGPTGKIDSAALIKKFQPGT